jgi:hypothetical protein
MLVKSTLVLSIWKMLGELNTAQNYNQSIVILHSTVLPAQVLGLVTISL